MTRRAIPGFTIALAVLVAGLLLAFVLGRYPISLGDIIDVMAAKLTGREAHVSPAIETVILHVRGPRVLAAALVGAALAVAGTAFQGLFRNPLVSPDILGASSGAALGAVLGIYFSLGVLGIECLAFAGGLVAVAGGLSDRHARAGARSDLVAGARRCCHRCAARRRGRTREILGRSL